MSSYYWRISTTRNNFLSKPRLHYFSHRGFSAAASGRRAKAPPPPPSSFLFGLPPYIWITAGGTTLAVAYAYFAFLEEVPLTHRRRWIATSPELEKQLGDQEYQSLLRQFRGKILPPQHPASRSVQRVGSRIAASALEFSKEQQLLSNKSQKAPFTYTVVRSDMANAFVLPGNHVFVMTGLFRYVRDEDELAGVLGHEVAHILSRHAGERMSGSVVMNFLARLSLLVDPSGVLLTFFLPAAALFHELPHSRVQETEADEIGVVLAASACYDPRASKRVFASMKEGAEEGKQPPEFLSTHPSHSSRISNFDKWMPEAMALYESDGGERCRQVRREMELARRHAAAANNRGGVEPRATNSTYGTSRAENGTPWQ